MNPSIMAVQATSSRGVCVSVGDCSKFLETPRHQCGCMPLFFDSVVEVEEGGGGGRNMENLGGKARPR